MYTKQEHDNDLRTDSCRMRTLRPPGHWSRYAPRGDGPDLSDRKTNATRSSGMRCGARKEEGRSSFGGTWWMKMPLTICTCRMQVPGLSQAQAQEEGNENACALPFCRTAFLRDTPTVCPCLLPLRTTFSFDCRSIESDPI